LLGGWSGEQITGAAPEAPVPTRPVVAPALLESEADSASEDQPQRESPGDKLSEKEEPRAKPQPAGKPRCASASSETSTKKTGQQENPPPATLHIPTLGTIVVPVEEPKKQPAEHSQPVSTSAAPVPEATPASDASTEETTSEDEWCADAEE